MLETGMIVYCICYAVSCAMAFFGHYYLSGAALMAAAGFLYYNDYRRSGNLIHLRGLFSAFWVGGQGVACLKLSQLQTDWGLKTWVCFFLAHTGFWAAYEILVRLRGGRESDERPARRRKRSAVRPVFNCIVVLTAVSLAAFLFEAVWLGFVPLFLLGVPHAYSEFHVTGIHYVTVSCVLVPALSVLYFLQGGSRSFGKNALVSVLTGVSLLIPILCVSRFQLVFALLTALFTYLAYTRSRRIVPIIAVIGIIVPVYVILTVFRSHSIEYLNGIFEMKNEAVPIFISQPYIYIANNYENFNCLVEALPEHTFGLRMLFPLWTLTGLKFLFPQLVNFPIYIDKIELTTLTMFYDAYYDFGAAGVLIFSVIMGIAAYCLVTRLWQFKNPVGYLLYAQMGVYFMLSFFTTWFSNTTTWFYLIVTGVMAFYCYWVGE